MSTPLTPDDEPKPTHWLLLTLFGWLVHLGLASGLCFRTLVTGPHYVRTFAEYNMALPELTQLVVDATGAAGESLVIPAWTMTALAAFDLAVLVALARWERPTWKWWFWGVTLFLLLMLGVVEFAFQLPTWKLREALSR